MWFVVSVVKGSKYFEADSQIGNRLMISDTTDMIVTGYSTAGGNYRFEMRKGNEAFTLQDIPKGTPKEEMGGMFLALAEKLGAKSLIVGV
jgi:hypothetical protein